MQEAFPEDSDATALQPETSTSSVAQEHRGYFGHVALHDAYADEGLVGSESLDIIMLRRRVEGEVAAPPHVQGDGGRLLPLPQEALRHVDTRRVLDTYVGGHEGLVAERVELVRQEHVLLVVELALDGDDAVAPGGVLVALAELVGGVLGVARRTLGHDRLSSGVLQEPRGHQEQEAKDVVSARLHPRPGGVSEGWKELEVFRGLRREVASLPRGLADCEDWRRIPLELFLDLSSREI